MIPLKLVILVEKHRWRDIGLVETGFLLILMRSVKLWDPLLSNYKTSGTLARGANILSSTRSGWKKVALSVRDEMIE